MEDKARHFLGRSYITDVLARFLKYPVQKVVSIEGYTKVAVESSYNIAWFEN